MSASDDAKILEQEPNTASGERPENIENEDFSNYYCAYGYLYNQKEMLEDPDRMQAYYESIIGNRKCFKDKVVLDVGTGSGVLAMWAAQAGARKVYAVEATYMAHHARDLIKANKLDHIITVLQSSVEDVVLDEKVDIIVSEWMGYFLLRESMLDSVFVARDKWLKPGGALYPSHATMYIAPAFDFSHDRRESEYKTAVHNWGQFTGETQRKYGVDFSSLAKPYAKECIQYFYQNALWVDASPSSLLGQKVEIKQFDLLTVTLEELKAVQKGTATMSVTRQGDENPHLNAILGWFTTDFKGSPENPTDTIVVLSTAPTDSGATHWGQQQFHVYPEMNVNNGDTFQVDWEIRRQKQNQRLLEIDFVMKKNGNAEQTEDEARKLRFSLN